MLDRSIKRLSKKARRGMRGYPLGVVACYGPDDKRASKMVASVTTSEGAPASTVLNAAAAMRRGSWSTFVGALFASTQLTLGLSEMGRRLC